MVYRCEHLSAVDENDEWKYCAFKVTSPNLLDRRRCGGRIASLDDVEQHCQELCCLMALRGVPYNKHILQLQEYFYHAETTELRLVTELLGPNLREWITEEAFFTENDAREVARVLNKAIIFMHSR